MKEKRNIGAVILAAGKGKRMNEKEVNKTALLLNGKPLISRSVSLLNQMEIKPVLVVVGHAKESVKNALKDLDILFIEQKEQLGTGHAVKIATTKIPENLTDIIILYGDDSYLYNQDILNKIINKHMMENGMLTFLTIKVPSPTGLGRVIRDNKGEVIDIIEEKDATENQRKINEINPNCYIFRSDFLKKYLPRIPKSPVTGEYYLTSLIKLAKENNEKILSVDGGFLPWKGVNTKEDLAEARNLYGQQ
jgi:bifunctional UDP-N-acetylglucosamine pyrophosphorylase/glucosamine-1-phosphate N-acetyltransferase